MESFDDYSNRLEAKRRDGLDPSHGRAGRKYRRSSDRNDFEVMPYPGCTVLAMPYPIETRSPLVELQRQIRRITTRIACVPDETLHMTLADLMAGPAYQGLASSQKERLICRARQIIATEPLAVPVRAEAVGIASFPGAVVALVALSRQGYQAIARLRETLYSDAEIQSLGVRSSKPFMAHVTLGYLEDPPLAALEIAALGQLKLPAAVHFEIQAARVFSFPHMSEFL